MTIKEALNIKPKIDFLVFWIRKKGFKYTYNRVYFYLFWSWIKNHPRFIKLLNWWGPSPSFIEIETTTKCNLKCVMCEHTYWNEPIRDMSFEQFKSIVDQFPKLKWIGLTGIGESFLNKDFMKMLRYVKSKGILVELFDPFFFIDNQIAEELVALEIDKIFVSLDAASKETYETIRVGSNFETVTSNAAHLFRLKKEKCSCFPEIAFHFVINKYNYNEILNYIDLVHSISQGESTSIQFTRSLHEFEEIKHCFMEIPKEAVEAAEAKGTKMGIPVVWNADVPDNKPPLSSCIEWTMPFIFVTGHVIACCSGNEAGARDFQKATALGNVFEQSFKEIWHGEKYKSLRRMLRAGKAPPACKTCCIYAKEGQPCGS
jgi:MoaA/NifB/PqqE/SkfB family radical SAM enzyme